MGYGAPLKNQNKGYAAQEKKDLLNDNPVAKVASGGSWMSKHISSPLAMGKAHSMAPKMESPMEKALVGDQNNLNEGLKKAIEAAPESPAQMKDKGKAGYVKHPTLTVKGKPLEYNPKFDPKKLITDQSEAKDRKSLKKDNKKK
jgi:hypothetical protein